MAEKMSPLQREIAYPRQFRRRNVFGLTGEIFGAQWGKKVTEHPLRRVNWFQHPEYGQDVWIHFPTDWERNGFLDPDMPVTVANGKHWAMWATGLATIESESGFPIVQHCISLCNTVAPRKPVIMEWGCGRGNAIRDLALVPELRGKAKLYGYGDIWDQRWNDVKGAQFLFFVKEHMVEYFRRSRQKLDFVFSYGGVVNVSYEGHVFDTGRLVRHLLDMARVMVPKTGTILFVVGGRHPELAGVECAYNVMPVRADAEKFFGPQLLVRRDN